MLHRLTVKLGNQRQCHFSLTIVLQVTTLHMVSSETTTRSLVLTFLVMTLQLSVDLRLDVISLFGYVHQAFHLRLTNLTKATSWISDAMESVNTWIECNDLSWLLVCYIDKQTLHLEKVSCMVILGSDLLVCASFAVGHKGSPVVSPGCWSTPHSCTPVCMALTTNLLLPLLRYLLFCHGRHHRRRFVNHRHHRQMRQVTTRQQQLQLQRPIVWPHLHQPTVFTHPACLLWFTGCVFSLCLALTKEQKLYLKRAFDIACLAKCLITSVTSACSWISVWWQTCCPPLLVMMKTIHHQHSFRPRFFLLSLVSCTYVSCSPCFACLCSLWRRNFWWGSILATDQAKVSFLAHRLKAPTCGLPFHARIGVFVCIYAFSPRACAASWPARKVYSSKTSYKLTSLFNSLSQGGWSGARAASFKLWCLFYYSSSRSCFLKPSSKWPSPPLIRLLPPLTPPNWPFPLLSPN